MTQPQPTELLGQSINAWDEFYQKHFDWVYKYSLSVCHNTLKAKQLTDKIFVKVLLSNPEVVTNNSQIKLQKEIALLFPYLGLTVDSSKELSAGRLLHLYYQPN